MSYQGDIRLGDTLDFKFTTVNTSGVPTTLAGTPAVAAYPNNSTTELTAGITLSVDFDARTGLNNVRIVATSGNGYAAGNYDLVITTGTVGGNSVVGYVVGSFSIEARSALMPTTAARTLDVSSTGEAGLDWANIGSPTTAQNLSGTSTKAVEPTVAGRTLDVSATGEAGLDWANIGAPTTTQNLSGTTISTSQVVASVTAAVTITAASVQAIWDALTSALTTVGSIGKLLVTNIDAAISSRLAPTVGGRTLDVTATGEAGLDWSNIGAPTTAQDLSGTTISTSQVVASVTGAVGSVTGAVGSVTGSVGGNVVGSVGSVTGNVGGNVTGSVGSLATQAKTDVKDQVVSALSTDTYAEPTGVPAATVSLAEKIGRVYQSLRNGLTVTASAKTFQNDAGTNLWKKPLSDDGTTYTEGEGTAP